ncbi:hypothetical protein MCJ35_31550 [Enterocloster sp. OA13]|uniref:hypothetical protein n=1 Tax=Enterocloster sp. OA13 TaxID=2914161 RepID=UPI001F06B703|nr:hypothetical protein [Enterocloster sp. OA13]
MENSSYIVEMTDIDKSFPAVHAVDGGQFNLKKGEIHSLIGKMGREIYYDEMLYGLYQPDGGTIRIYGKEMNI